MHRVRRAVRLLAALLAAMGTVVAVPAQERDAKAAPVRESEPPNVLFLIADDLGAQALGCYGNRICRTPAIDALAARGVVFRRAYCQYPLCGPSRAALMSGMYPPDIGVMTNGQAGRFGRNLGERPSLAQFFRRHGWHTARVSKIYHMRVPGDITAGVHGPDHAASWDERYSVQAPEWMSEGPAEHLSNERLRRDPDKHYGLGFGTAFYVVRAKGEGVEQADVQAADRAIELLGRLAGRRFFLAVGFVRPHVPLVAPERYFEPYPPETIEPPRVAPGDRDDIPRLGLTRTSERWGLDDDLKKRKVLAAYYAAVSFMDAQVGRVLARLEELGLDRNTIVVFTSDHGYHLGEHGFWQKLSLHEESARIPLVIAAPGVRPAVTDALAQQIDLYPTLAGLAGLEPPDHLQGRSLVPVLRDPAASVHERVLCFKRTGRLVRTDRWALLDWRDGSAELYDMREDPRQVHNLATDPAFRAVLEQLRGD